MNPRFLFFLIFSVGIGISIPIFLGGGQALSLLAEISPLEILMLLMLVTFAWLFNASRVFLLLKDQSNSLGFCKTFALILACDFAVRATPAGIGGPITAISLLKQVSIRPATTVAAFSLLFILDIVLVLAISFILYAISIQQWTEAGLLFSLGMMLSFGLTLALASLAALSRYYRNVATAFGRLLRIFPNGRRISYFLARQFIMAQKGGQEFFAIPVIAKIMITVSSVLFWFSQFSMLYSCLWLLGADISWIIVAIIQFLAMGAGRLTMLPAGSVGLEATAMGLLMLWVDPGTAAAAILLWRSITLLPGLSAGAIAIFILGLNLKIAKNASPEKPGFYSH